MDPYSDQIQELINSDIGRSYDENSLSNDSTYPSLSSVPSMDIDDHLLDNSLDGHDQNTWLTKNHLISFDSDGIGSLFVNPNTGMPTHLSSQESLINSIRAESLSSSHQKSDQNNKSKQSSNSLISSNIFPSSEIVTVQSSNINKSSQNIQISKTQSVVQIQPSLLITDSSPKPKHKKAFLNHISEANKVEKVYPKPAYSYSCLIAMALKNSKTGSLPVNEIYTFMTDNFPYFKTAPNGWKNSVRHNLSLNKCFEKVEQPVAEGSQRKRCLWAMNPAKVDKLDEELHKCTAKDPAAIRRSMANPERLPLLEKGQLKHLYDKGDDKTDKEDHSSSDDVDFEDTAATTSTTDSVTTLTTTNTTTSHPSKAIVPPSMDSSMGLDALSDLELQKGIWSQLCGDSIPFIPESSQPTSPGSIEDAEKPGLAIGSYVDRIRLGPLVKTEKCES